MYIYCTYQVCDAILTFTTICTYFIGKCTYLSLGALYRYNLIKYNCDVN